MPGPFEHKNPVGLQKLYTHEAGPVQNNYPEWNKPDRIENIMYDFIYRKLVKLQTNL